MRRRSLLTYCALLIPSAVAIPFLSRRETAAQDGKGGDVATERGDISRSGQMPGPGPEVPESLWLFRTEDFVMAPPVVVDSVVFFGSRDGNVYAVDASTGNEIWRFVTDGEVEASPAVVNDVVYIGSEDGNIYALAASSGIEIWRFSTGSVVSSSPAIVDDTLYLGSNDGNFFAIDIISGSVNWRTLIDPAPKTPAFLGGVVYVATVAGRVYALDAASGKILWDFTAFGLVTSVPAAIGDTVIFGSGYGFIYAIDAMSGIQRWQISNDESSFSSPSVVDGVVYIGGQSGTIYVINYSTGDEIRQFSSGSSPLDLVIAAGVIYVSTWIDRLYAINLNTGLNQWDGSRSMNLTTAATVSNGVVYIGSKNGLLAIGKSAAQAWRTYFDRVTPALIAMADSPAFPRGWIIGEGTEPKHDFVGSQWKYGQWYAAGFSEAESDRSGIGVLVYGSVDAAGAEVSSTIAGLKADGWTERTDSGITDPHTCLVTSGADGSEAVCFVQRDRLVIIGYSSLQTDAPDAVLKNASELARMGLFATEDLTVPE